MKIFISHASNFNYEEELYKPLRESVLNQKHEIIFSYANGKHGNTKDSIRDCDLVVGEVSSPEIGVGIELGWANASYVTIICFYKKDAVIAESLHYVTESIFEYDSMKSMIAKITEVIEAL